MSMTVSVRVAHLGIGKAKGQRYHDTRRRTPAYVDAERTKDNSTIIEQPTEADLRQRCEDRRVQRGAKRAMKSNAAILTSGIITFGKEAQPVIEAMTPAEQDALFTKTAQAIADQWRTDLVSLTVHRDESAIHAHFGLLAVDRDGKPLSKTLDTRKLQDIAGEVYQQYGITRGTPKAERLARGDDLSKIVHRSVAELHRDLPAEIETKRREIEAQRKALDDQRRELEELEAKAEKNRRLVAEQEAKLQAGRVAEELAQKRIATYQKREADAKAKAEKLAKEIEAKEAEFRLIDIPRPNLPPPNLVKIKDGLIKSRSEYIHTDQDIKRYSQEMESWAKNAATKTMRQKSRTLDQKEKALIDKDNELSQRESDIAKREQSVESREKRTRQIETQNRRLLNEREMIGINIGHMLGVENASMNRGKIVDAIVKTGDLAKFREILRENKVMMKGQGKGIGR